MSEQKSVTLIDETLPLRTSISEDLIDHRRQAHTSITTMRLPTLTGGPGLTGSLGLLR